MSPERSPIDRAAVFGELRWLADSAKAGGADPERVTRLFETVICLMLDQADPRRVESIELARRVGRAKAAGVPVRDLMRRFGKSRSQVYWLLHLCRTTSSDSSAVERLQTSQGRDR